MNHSIYLVFVTEIVYVIDCGFQTKGSLVCRLQAQSTHVGCGRWNMVPVTCIPSFTCIACKLNTP